MSDKGRHHPQTILSAPQLAEPAWMTRRSVCVFCGSNGGNDPQYLAAAERVGTLMAQRGIELVYGGGNIGMMGAVDLTGHASPFEGEASDYLGALGWRVYREARARGAYLRPLGNTVYLCPPLTIPDRDLDRLLAIMLESIEAVTHQNPK